MSFYFKLSCLKKANPAIFNFSVLPYKSKFFLINLIYATANCELTFLLDKPCIHTHEI